MSELTDLEICKRIAEIEGHEKSLFEGVGERDFYIKCPPMNAIRYNPLTDDALCFRLMVKYDIELTPMYNGCWSATVATLYTLDEQIDYQLGYTWSDANPNKAICLAIIEANKEQANENQN